ncbi:hypothetical protein [Paenibacillus pabuli]|uniref:hypothetical protein n=1 Tax=Paenibacillus pabuli TaxID=1472 RepID=UPI003CF371FC
MIGEINSWIRHIASNYILIITGAVLFFAVKSVIGFYTYKHYNKQLEHLHHKMDVLIREQQLIAQQFSMPDENREQTQTDAPSESPTQTHLI